MEIFYKTLCNYMESEAGNVSETKQIILRDSTSNTKEIYEKMISTLAKIQDRSPETLTQKLYEYVICRKWFCFVLPILFAVTAAGHTANWYFCVFCMLCAFLFIYLTVTNPPNDGLYIWRLKIHLWFWGIPQLNDGMTNPKCIFVQHEAFEYATPQEWMRKECGKELMKYLYIFDLKVMENSITAAQSNNHWSGIVYHALSMQSLLLLLAILISYYIGKAVAIMVILVSAHTYFLQYSLSKFQVKILIVLFIAVLIVGIPFGIAYISAESSIDFILAIMSVGISTITLSLLSIRALDMYEKYTKTNIEINMQVIDVICRLQNAIKHESIFFAVVTSDPYVLTIVPEEYHRYFKFIIKPGDNSESPNTYHQTFDLSEIPKITPSRPMIAQTKTNLRNWVVACLRCVNENASQFVVDGLKFLSLLIEISNDLLTDAVMVSVVRLQLTVFAANYTNEISFKDQSDVLKVKKFFGYLESLGIIPKAKAAVEPINPNLRDWVDVSLRCINENASQFVTDGLKDLLWLIENNNDHLTEIDMLNMVKMQITAFASNYTNEISFKDQNDVLKVKTFLGYLENLGIIPRAITAVELTNPKLRG